MQTNNNHFGQAFLQEQELRFLVLVQVGSESKKYERIGYGSVGGVTGHQWFENVQEPVVFTFV